VNSFTSHESPFDAEHWVGGSRGFAHPVLSKTHTRTSGVTEKRLLLVFGYSLKARG
jgi:hypothetical protein